MLRLASVRCGRRVAVGGVNYARRVTVAGVTVGGLRHAWRVTLGLAGYVTVGGLCFGWQITLRLAGDVAVGGWRLTVCRFFCGDFDWVRFLVACFLYKISTSPRRIICCVEKVGAEMPRFKPNFSWVWVDLVVGEFVDFTIRITFFPTQENLTYRKDANISAI